MTTGQVQPRRLLPVSPRVVFIGSGPGESGLMTIRGADILANAEIVVYDTHVHSEIVTAYVPQATEIIEAAQLGATASTRGRKLAELARPDKTVVRLSSDDGILFTTTTAEAAVCRKADVDVEIVPGVGLSAATSAYTGTALTTNRVRSVRFIEAGPQTHVDVSRHRNTTHVLTGTSAELLKVQLHLNSGTLDKLAYVRTVFMYKQVFMTSLRSVLLKQRKILKSVMEQAMMLKLVH